ncbi:MAG: hypothetical protein CMM47_04875 [Rhodospirillaceae bacterium]|nr:hypothetical protein [Rhodospirillaceae bacterium]
MLHSRTKHRGRRLRGNFDRLGDSITPTRFGSRNSFVERGDEGKVEGHNSLQIPVIGRALNRLGPKGRFLGIALIIAVGITLFWVYTERKIGADYLVADRHNPAQISLGRTLYRANCAFCHGDKLEGKPGWEEAYPRGGRPALPLNGDGTIVRLSDHDLFNVTKYGGQSFSPASYKNDMPGFEMQLSDADMWAILAYVKSTWTEDVIEEQRAATEERND